MSVLGLSGGCDSPPSAWMCICGKRFPQSDSPRWEGGGLCEDPASGGDGSVAELEVWGVDGIGDSLGREAHRPDGAQMRNVEIDLLCVNHEHE